MLGISVDKCHGKLLAARKGQQGGQEVVSRMVVNVIDSRDQHGNGGDGLILQCFGNPCSPRTLK